MKADLHHHGPIGMHEPWLEIQKYGRKNLIESVFETAVSRGIGIVAITSEQHEIKKYSIHDRFGQLVIYAKTLPSEYSYHKLGDKDIAFIIERESDEKKLIILNGQTVVVTENDGIRLDHLVVGSNQVPNHRNLRDTITYCKDNGLIQIAEHPFCEKHFGLGEERVLEYLDEYEAVEGHNSQMVLPECLSWLPKIGKYNKGVNKKTQNIAETNRKPWIATSDAHRIEDLGISYIEFSDLLLKIENEEKLLENLGQIIKGNCFTRECNYENIGDWFKWTWQYYSGSKKDKYRID